MICPDKGTLCNLQPVMPLHQDDPDCQELSVADAAIPFLQETVYGTRKHMDRVCCQKESTGKALHRLLSAKHFLSYELQ